VRLGNSVSPGTATSLASTFGSLIGGELPVRLVAWDGSVAGPVTGPTVRLRSPAALRRMFWHPGELGAAQAYVCGDPDVDGDLGSALTEVWSQITQRRLVAVKASPGVLARLVAVAVRAGALGGPLPPPATQARLRGSLHSPSRDRAAIRHHYDTSNAFYRLILDPSMAYSCAYWEGFSSNLTLAQAQYDKLDRICRKLGLDEQPGMRLLDVGCGWGWGWLSLHAAEQYGARVLGVTLSGEQKDYIDAALTERGLGDRVEIRSRITALSRTDPLTQRRPSRWANTSAHRTTRPMPESCTAPFAPAPGC
jgi:cyclopropane-fatty-acyl-phospholipid synthase